MRNTLAALAILTAATAACGGGGNGGTGGDAGATLPECPTPPATLVGTSNLPPGFPIPPGVLLTQSRAAGPTTVVNGFSDDSIPTLFEAWSKALDEPPYSVVKSEQEAHDAEVNFSGEDTTGQVRLGEECEGRTSVQITARPL